MHRNTFNRQQAVQNGRHGRSTQHSPPPRQVPMWSESVKEHPLHPLSSQQYRFYRTEDLVWQLLHSELYQTLLSHDRRQSTPASIRQTQEFVFPLYCSKLGDHPSTFHFEHTNCSAHSKKELTVPLIYALYILNVHLKGYFFYN